MALKATGTNLQEAYLLQATDSYLVNPRKTERQDLEIRTVLIVITFSISPSAATFLTIFFILFTWVDGRESFVRQGWQGQIRPAN